MVCTWPDPGTERGAMGYWKTGLLNYFARSPGLNENRLQENRIETPHKQCWMSWAIIVKRTVQCFNINQKNPATFITAMTGRSYHLHVSTQISSSSLKFIVVALNMWKINIYAHMYVKWLQTGIITTDKFKILCFKGWGLIGYKKNQWLSQRQSWETLLES